MKILRKITLSTKPRCMFRSLPHPVVVGDPFTSFPSPFHKQVVQRSVSCWRKNVYVEGGSRVCEMIINSISIHGAREE